MAERYPLARTEDEVYLYISLQPCEVCGQTGPEVRGVSSGAADGEPIRGYETACSQCGTTRTFWFRFPEAPAGSAAGPWRFGGAEPSELLDPGQWLMLADAVLAEAPETATGLSDPQRREARDRVELAVAAFEEVLKFIRGGEDRVSPFAFWSQPGHELQLTAAWRFEREWLESDLRRSREILAALQHETR